MRTANDLDVDLTAALFQSVAADDGFESLVRAVENRVDEDWGTAKAPAISPAVERQFGAIEHLLDDERTLSSSDPLERAVEEVPTAALVLDSSCRMVLGNTNAERVFGLRPGQEFRREWIDPRFSSQFESFVRAVRAGSNSRRLVIRLDTEALKEVSDEHVGSIAEVLVIRSELLDHPHLAMRTLEIPWTAELHGQLEEAFGLTQAEIEICQSFFETHDLKDVAAARGTSMGTVRTQLKTIYSKTDTASQSGLLHLLSAMAARAASGERSSLAEWADPLGREDILIRGDGRKLAYTWQGDPDGRPVVVLHGGGLAHVLPGKMDTLFRKAGFKLYLPSRPGFGHSEYDPNLRAIDDHTYAITEFCRLMGLRGVPALSFSSGMCGLAKAAAADAGLFSSITQVGLLLARDMPLLGVVSANQKVYFSVLQSSPKLLEILTRLSFRTIRKQGVDVHINRVLSGHDDARALFRTGRFNALIRNAAGHILHQGPPVFVRELQQPMEPWLPCLEQIDAPILYLLPERGTAEEQLAYKAAIPQSGNARFATVKGCAELYIYDAAEELARLAIEHFSARA